MDVKDIKCPFQWWEKMNLFVMDWFFVHQILGIVRSQIEMEKYFSLIEIFINLRFFFHN
jgi:hypothetical protein